MHRNIAAENLKKYGVNKAIYEPPVPLQAVDQLYQKQNIPPGMQYAAEDQPKAAVKKSFLEKTSSIEQRLEIIGRYTGKQAFDLAVREEIEGAQHHDAKYSDKLTPLVRDAANQAKQNVLKMANENRMIPDREQEIKTNSRRSSVIQGDNQGGRTININLNKPMIEYFTINTNGVKEGINDFKHKVEEALLEILNSANAIH